MGNQIASSSRLHVDFMSELPKVGDGEGIVFGRVLGGGRFLKTLQCWHEGQMVVVKAYSKRDVTQSLREQGERLENIRDKLYRPSHTNVLPFIWFPETQRAAFLVRPFLNTSLRERMLARPFLTVIEKKWLAYQLLNALSQCHRAGIVHGDVKSNNVQVTSWNWLLLTDFTGLKPTYLPEDNPADLSFFFDDEYDKRCFVAPERFYESTVPENARPKGECAPKMDIFSAGCVIAELFLDGESPFQISQLLAYRKGEYDPTATLSKLDDVHIRELVTAMMSLSPGDRPDATATLSNKELRVFPAYFGQSLHDLAWRTVGTLDPDESIAHLSRIRDTLPMELGGFEGGDASEGGEGFVRPRCSGLVHFLVLVTSSMRSVRSPASKLEALRMLEWASRFVDDDIVMQRLVPYVSAIVSDDNENSLVRGSAIHILSSMLAQIRHFPLSDQHIFPEYILPALAPASAESAAEFVRVAYAANIGSLAETAQRFLDIAHERRLRESQGRLAVGAAEGGLHEPDFDVDVVGQQQGYDAELVAMQDAFVGLASDMLSGSSSAVKRTMLRDILRLCVLLGRERTNNSLLPLIITVLNDRSDWELRLAFFENLVGVASFVGRDSLEHFILPCIAQALTDMHELVVEGALAALASLTELGLFSRQASIRVAKASLPLLLHPSSFMNLGVVGLQSALARQLGLADAYVHMAPALRPYLRHEVYHITDDTLREALVRPVSSYSFLQAIEKARRSYERGVDPMRRPDSVRAPSTKGKRGSMDDLLEEEDAVKLKLLEAYISSVAVARLTQQKADEQQVAERRLEQEALASEEWLQDEWDNLFGGPNPNLIVEGPHRKAVSRADSVMSSVSGVSGVMISPIDGGPTQGPESVRSYKSNRSGGSAGDVPARPMQDDADLPLGMADARALSWLNSNKDRSWRPKGVLIADLKEHKGAISRMCVSDDHLFFLTGSHDGSVKVWDCSSLDREVAKSSKLTYSQVGKVTAMCVCERSQSFASATDVGSVHVVRVDCASSSVATGDPSMGGGAWTQQRSFGGMSTVSSFDLSHERSVLHVQHCPKGNSSLLMVSTQAGNVHAMDLRQKQIAYTLRPELRRGLPCCVCVGADRNWLVVGTTRGFFIVYDMRFQIDVQWWRHPSKCEIKCIEPYPADKLCMLGGQTSASAGPWVIAAAGRNQVSVWEVSSGVCEQHFSATASGYVSDVSDVGMRMGCEEGAADGAKLSDFGLSELDALSAPEESVRAVHMPAHCSYLLSGGTDRRIRFWNIVSPQDSHCLGGSQLEGETSIYGSERIRGPMGEVEHVFERRVPSTSVGGGYAQQAYFSGERREVMGARGSLPKPPNEHSDAVTCLAVTRSPYGERLLSAGRDGVVKVWS